MIEAAFLIMTQNWSWDGELANLLFRDNQTDVSKYLGVFPNIRRGGNNARVWNKTASSAVIIVYFVDVYVSCDGF